jgi:hypothetical protein
LLKTHFHCGFGNSTRNIEKFVHQGVEYVNVPGIDDVEIRDRVISDVKSEIMKGGKVKIIFVLPQNSGRIAKNELDNFQVVFDQLQFDLQDNLVFGVIVNKIDSRDWEELRKPVYKEKILQCIVGGIN